MAEIDLEADAKASAGGTLESVAALVEVLAKTEARLALAEELVAALKAKQALLLLTEIPAAMDAAKCTLFKTSDGGRIEVVDQVFASIPKAKLPEALAWLRANNHDDLIKSQITLATGKGESELAAKIVAAIKAAGGAPEVKETVHAQTLSAWCREQLAKDNPPQLPAELLGLFQSRVAKIKTAKEK